MCWAFNVIRRRCGDIRPAPGANDFPHQPGMMLRALKALHLEFDLA